MWKIKYTGDVLIKLHDAIWEFGFSSGKPNSNLNELSDIIKRCIWWKVQIHEIGGPSDHTDGVI